MMVAGSRSSWACAGGGGGGGGGGVPGPGGRRGITRVCTVRGLLVRRAENACARPLALC